MRFIKIINSWELDIIKLINKILLLILFMSVIYISIIAYKTPIIIAHAGGGVKDEDTRYLNSLEGVIEHYKQGTRIFEIDFMLTSEYEIIAMHNYDVALYGDEWSFENRISLAEFKSISIDGLYTPLTFNDVLDLMIIYPDMIIFADTKESDNFINILYDKIDIEISNKSKELAKRIIPQLYNEDMYHYFEDNFEYDEYVFALYRTDITNKEVVEILEKYDKINYLAISTARENRFSLIFTVKFKRLDVEVYIHTVNSKLKAFLYETIGVDGIYSDWIYQE